jgi:hypothetical protein
MTVQLTHAASNDAMPLPDHLYTRGLLQGRHSDITVIAFGQRYNLHRLILDRAPFFTTALSEPWIESRNKEVTLHPEALPKHRSSWPLGSCTAWTSHKSRMSKPLGYLRPDAG